MTRARDVLGWVFLGLSIGALGAGVLSLVHAMQGGTVTASVTAATTYAMSATPEQLYREALARALRARRLARWAEAVTWAMVGAGAVALGSAVALIVGRCM